MSPVYRVGVSVTPSWTRQAGSVALRPGYGVVS